MFGWLKGRRAKEQEFFESMMTAAASGEQRARINRALGSLGVELPPADKNSDFSVKASAEFIKALSHSSGISLVSPTDDEAFVLGIFSLITSDYVSQKVGAQFEGVATVAFLDAFGLRSQQRLPEILGSYNEMATKGDMTKVIGTVLARWFSQPSPENFKTVQNLLDECIRHA